ncbi:unnamed protein product [Ilex paraguariensis]|uniref:CRA domain-containing protein n=1 Tax=Ilex paraguariensis TaxID=185542 RepID=A0ABC8R3E8_9AQUA
MVASSTVHLRTHVVSDSQKVGLFLSPLLLKSSPNHNLPYRGGIVSRSIDLDFCPTHQHTTQKLSSNHAMGKSRRSSSMRVLKGLSLFSGTIGVRVGQLEDAVAYGRAEFEKFYRLAEFDDLVKDCAALLAYEQPQKSSVGYLLEESQRELVADAVNAMILSTNPNGKDVSCCLHSCLERLLRQLTACFLERRSLNGDQGEAFHLRRVLNNDKKG